MTASLLVLCLAAFALVALVGSIALTAGLPLLDRVAARLSPGQRVRLWLGAAWAPGVLAVLAVGVSLLPALGLGIDHCLAHDPHHPHLCPHHAGGAPGAALVVAAALLFVRVAHVVLQVAQQARLSHATARAIGQACDARGEALVIDSDVPQAFVLGTLRPRVHVSRGLFALGDPVAGPVLAHERAHARRRDPLWRAVCALVTAAHLPGTRAALRRRLAAAQEMSADEDAAAAVGDRPAVAQALLTVARCASVPAPGLSIAHGDLETRVRALLRGRQAPSRMLPPAMGLACLGGLVIFGGARNWIHHALETLLGALS